MGCAQVKRRIVNCTNPLRPAPAAKGKKINQSATSIVPADVTSASITLKGSKADTISQQQTQVGENHTSAEGEAGGGGGNSTTEGKTTSGDATGASGKKAKQAKIDTSAKNIKQTHHRQKVATIEITVSCRNLPDISIVEKINPIAILYIEQGSVERAQKMSQFIRENELDDNSKEPIWVEKGRSEIAVGKEKPIFMDSFVFEAVNFERLIFKIEIYHIIGDKKVLKLKRYETEKLDLTKHKYIGEQSFRIYDIIKNGKFETKEIANFKPKQTSLQEELKKMRTTMTIRFNEIQQTTTKIQMCFGIKDYDNGKVNNKKTITNMFYVLGRQREMGEFVTVYTSEQRKYDYLKAKVNFSTMDIMLKDLCRNEETALLRFQLFEYKDKLLTKKELEEQLKKMQEEKLLEEEEEAEEEYGEEGGEEGEEGKEKNEKEGIKVDDKRRGVLGIKKTELDQEKSYDLISEVKFKLTDIYNPKDPEEEKRKFELPHMTNEHEVKAKMNILKCLFLDRFTFLDYIQGGCEVNTIIGMDFTLSNKHQLDPRSLHYLDPDLLYYYHEQSAFIRNRQQIKEDASQTRLGEATNAEMVYSANEGLGDLYMDEINQLENPYQKALRKTIKYLDYYDTDGFMPFFGYGAKLPPFKTSVSHCFAVNGNIFAPEERGVLQLMEQYAKCNESVALHGPSALAPILRMVKDLASQQEISQSEQFYYLLVIFTNGRVMDMDATQKAIIDLSYLPVSVVFIGVWHDRSGKEKQESEWAPDFTNLEKLDADSQKLEYYDPDTGKILKQARDCVQFLDFSKCMNDEAEFAMQLMQEIPKQIKEFFEEKALIPKDMEAEILGTKGAASKTNRRDFEINKRKRRAAKTAQVNPVLMERKEKFINDVVKIGFLRKDIELVLKKKGLYAMEKSLLIEQLSAMATIPELQKEKEELERQEAAEKAAEEELKRKRQEELDRMGDIRDQFLYKVPLLAPAGFKALKRHKYYCKICYENKINCAFMPCKCELFCMDCAVSPDSLKVTCPKCNKPIEELVRIYDVKALVKNIRQL